MIANSNKIKRATAISVFVLLTVLILNIVSIFDNTVPKLIIPKVGAQEIIAENVELELFDSLQNETATVYKTKFNIAKEQQEVKQIFGLSDSMTFGTLAIPNKVDDRAAFVGMDVKSGRWYYQTDLAYDTGENVPTEDEALKIAEALLNDYDIYPIDQLGEPVMSATTTGDGIFEPVKVLRRDITYYPNIDGYDVYGVFRITISVGSNGEIVSLEKLANEYEVIKEVPLKNADSLKKDFDRGDFSLSGEPTGKEAKVSNVDVILYADPESEFIQPAYKITDNSDSYSIFMDAQKR